MGQYKNSHAAFIVLTLHEPHAELRNFAVLLAIKFTSYKSVFFTRCQVIQTETCFCLCFGCIWRGEYLLFPVVTRYCVWVK